MGSPRTFTDSPAVRSAVPLLVGLVGPSGSGKTMSALRLAAGMQKVVGGDVGGIDTEANRMLHYADAFKFRHLPFGAPFDPLSYLAAVEHFAKKGVKTIIIDSASHMHEGPGGTLEAHDREMGGDFKRSMLAWQKPKAELRRFLNTVLQLQVNTIWCFRAKEKVKVIQGKDPKPMGFQPVAGDEMFFEMTLSCLLYPNCGGVPSWTPEEMGERSVIKLPQQFQGLFREKRPLDESIGTSLATWAAGGTAAASAGASSPVTSPTEGAKSAATETSAASPKASAGQLEALATQLGANGLSTKDARREWFWKLTGKTLSDATADDVQRAIEQAEVEAA
jgi:hypothetical protein